MGSGLPQFRDSFGAEGERWGFVDPYGQHELPGQTWAEGNMFTSPFMLPNCNMEDAVFNDTVWQFGYPDRLRLQGESDRVFAEIFYSDPVRRLQAVEQLTLPPEYSTVPNTGAFSRFEHVWGSVLFVRQLADQEGIPQAESAKLQLRTLVSDIAHTTGSHLGDWMFQGMGGAENQHDLELAGYLEATGLNDILRRNGYQPASVIFPEVTDWIEAPQPDLCVDRVDYGLREMNRWNDVVRSRAIKSSDFTLTPEGMLAMKDQQLARIFAEGFLLLSQEHWSEPTHRFLLDTFMLRTKLFYAQGGAPRSWVFRETFEDGALVPLHEIHPRDLMYVTDPSQALAMGMPNLGSQILDSIMKSVAQYRRQYVWPGRRERINQYMHQFVGNNYDAIKAGGAHRTFDDPSFNYYLEEYPSTLPLGFALLTIEEAERDIPINAIDFLQLPLKPRQIDPLVQSGGGFRRLSQLDPSYAQRLEEHKQQMQQPHIARIVLPDPSVYEAVRSIVSHVDTAWQRRLEQSRRMSSAELKALVNISSREVFGQYPFMTFLSY